jgi:hypothetical protein
LKQKKENKFDIKKKDINWKKIRRKKIETNKIMKMIKGVVNKRKQ